ncbi:hypothetical protein KEM48_010013 [Puccinia striiformis f. sp. tritici PST-130]|nr:hypothetical protein KEM48_010013 [Puccinia striiformis f. sp. tritici PST-130]
MVVSLFKKIGPRMVLIESHGCLVGLITLKDLLRFESGTSKHAQSRVGGRRSSRPVQQGDDNDDEDQGDGDGDGDGEEGGDLEELLEDAKDLCRDIKTAVVNWVKGSSSSTVPSSAIIGSAMNDESGDSSEDSDLEDLIVALIILKKNCYLAPRVRLGRAPNITGYLFSLDDAWFKQEFWMLQGSFHQLVSEMQAHPVFQNQSNIPQRPVRDQLMVTLKRMGTYGNGASVGMLARFSEYRRKQLSYTVKPFYR